MHTVIDLLQGDLRILRQVMLGFGGEHKGLRFLRRCHRGTVLRIHGYFFLFPADYMYIFVSADRVKERDSGLCSCQVSWKG